MSGAWNPLGSAARRSNGEKKRRDNPEERLQMAMAEFLTLHENMGRLWFCHVPNGGKRSKAQAGRFKAMGVKAGVYDLLIMSRRNERTFTHWVEVKVRGGASEKQKDFGHMMREKFKCQTAVCTSVDELDRQLKDWGIL